MTIHNMGLQGRVIRKRAESHSYEIQLDGGGVLTRNRKDLTPVPGPLVQSEAELMMVPTGRSEPGQGGPGSPTINWLFDGGVVGNSLDDACTKR